MTKRVKIIGAGLAGSEAALQLAARDVSVELVEMRPDVQTAVHRSANAAELVCSNSLKSLKEDSAAGMLKYELSILDSFLFKTALDHAVGAGNALAVDREAFSKSVTKQLEHNPFIRIKRREATCILEELDGFDGLILASGPLTSDKLADDLSALTGAESLAFYDAAAPLFMADSLDYERLFFQNRYEDGGGDYLNASFTKESYERFYEALIDARRVINRDFESKELFSACQPLEEIARSGKDALRFGPFKPVGIKDPQTGLRPWAVAQLRPENREATAYNLVGAQTNLTFGEQERVFRLIPGLEQAEFARYGVMHRNTFVDAPHLLDDHLSLSRKGYPRVYLVGQLSGTEGYCEAIRSGLHGALAVFADMNAKPLPQLDKTTVFGSLLAYATDPETKNYQPMHVNFGIIEPLAKPIKSKKDRYQAYARRAAEAVMHYRARLQEAGL